MSDDKFEIAPSVSVAKAASAELAAPIERTTALFAPLALGARTIGGAK